MQRLVSHCNYNSHRGLQAVNSPPTPANTPAEAHHDDAAGVKLQSLLQQLAASITDVQRDQAGGSKGAPSAVLRAIQVGSGSRQSSTTMTRAMSHFSAHTLKYRSAGRVSEPNVLSQDGLQGSNEQLGRLLAQQGRQLLSSPQEQQQLPVPSSVASLTAQVRCQRTAGTSMDSSHSCTSAR